MEPSTPMRVKLHVLHLDECDPKKCTAVKLKKFGLVKFHDSLRTVPVRSIKLNPFAERVLAIADRDAIMHAGLTVIDCSWKQAGDTFKNMHFRNDRRLSTTFLAANSINYSIPGKLSSVEAFAAALILTGFFEEAEFLLSKFGWGHTFLELNHDRIEEIKGTMQREPAVQDDK